jgi:hypothetical protein
MTQLEIVLSVAFAVQFLASVSLALELWDHNKKLEILKSIVSEMGMYVAEIIVRERERDNAKSKSKIS